MNLPNKLTILRVIMIPFFLIFMLTDFMGANSKYIALTLFVIASFTDFLDGYLARKYKLVTNFGKFMDPLADKLLVSAALISFVELQALSAWIVITIISREFIISGFRLVASDNGVVIAASYWGKFKTVAQMIMIILLIIDIQASYFVILENIFIYLALILTIVSLLDYLIKNKDVLRERSVK
ncbi:CDP-diacylglycerol--glycerol-3-phosphate 3-phosphatidyltransferase [Candidatus Galacturonibacter soehngenii]|uniref:CDP-diacylglycerol--glycerol-3-phosphate 3-phosphatidyltransferase n=1 Tax=Candidatus Galacturonatibacter soehngenii TaxID=2307010 RepID=A0A7V7QLC3_9FIRM|nr:CDP-diacylglycerol--glycerol-3-phosphate 3-phosphatidyltransferase [Candidatus Galacturonibacter soehngenii]KAB1439319.1 CDP-diacylglycerol--glycerol-3-phosphate 3-phosphatidyltransferase [Candidatus Galacturonibacter soehngenii]MBA4687509.1 CDP-diacylglycerol--glycerol-3-phosphate 3-phosphatidyltransferase [Candidatus Galacturonibacter soehngenii]